MNKTCRAARPAAPLGLARLLVAALLLAGLFGMHGLSGPATASTVPAAARMLMPSSTSFAPAPAVSRAMLMEQVAVPQMPMPGGHGAHDMAHDCVAILSLLFVFILLALARAHGAASGIDLLRSAVRPRAPTQRRIPLCLSITQLGISRT